MEGKLALPYQQESTVTLYQQMVMILLENEANLVTSTQFVNQNCRQIVNVIFLHRCVNNQTVKSKLKNGR